MKTRLEHLPEAKRQSLARVVWTLFAAFEQAVAGGTMAWKRDGPIPKVMVFGSYARGDWVDDPVV